MPFDARADTCRAQPKAGLSQSNRFKNLEVDVDAVDRLNAAEALLPYRRGVSAGPIGAAAKRD